MIIILAALLFVVKTVSLFIKKDAKAELWKNILEVVATVFAIVGITVIGLFGNVYEKIPAYKRHVAEKNLQKIGVGVSKEFVDELFGIPKSVTKEDLPLINNGVGECYREIYDDGYCTLICYYYDDESLFGYFVIDKDKKFKPKLTKKDLIHFFGYDTVFYQPIKSMFKYDSPDKSLFRMMIAYRMNPYRADSSGFYWECYYHHMSTGGLYIGIGQSEFGFYEHPEYYTPHERKIPIGDDLISYRAGQRRPFNFINDSPVLNIKYNNIAKPGEIPYFQYLRDEDVNYNLLRNGDINVVSFFDSNPEVNIADFFEKVLYNCMVLTKQEYSRLGLYSEKQMKN